MGPSSSRRHDRSVTILLSSALAACRVHVAATDDLSEAAALSGAWSDAQVRAIAAKTLQVDLPLAAGTLTEPEAAAAAELLAAGQRLHDLYLLQRHHQALAARDVLQRHPSSRAMPSSSGS